jgi:hypothetical protein
LRDQNNCILADLMKVFMVSQKQPFILQLTWEILDFNCGL